MTDVDLRGFRDMLGDTGVATSQDLLNKASVDWMRQYRGNASVVLRPSCTSEVSAILRYCNERHLPVVPQGGNTGLVGGAVPIWDEVVISMERMNRIISIDDRTGSVVAEAGCILQSVDDAIAPHWIMPLDLGAKGSCQIGGNVSTNAGGLRYLRYGSLHGSVLGLQAVLASGEVIDSLSTLRKDNVGFDVKQLFIGSEGTLGIVTAVAIQAAPRPSAVNVAVFACESFDKVQALLACARQHLGEILSAAELVDGHAMRVTTDVLGLSCPLGHNHPFYVLLETQGSNAEHDSAKLQGLLEAVTVPAKTTTAGAVVLDGVVAQGERQARSLWRLREDVAVGISTRGHVFKYDFSLPMAHFYTLVEETRARLARWGPSHDVRVVGYGHLGDANVHLNVSTPDRDQPYHAQLGAELEPWVFEWVMSHGGSISAEHGLGQGKAKMLPRAKPPAVVSLMRSLKATMDPRGILNPGKVLPLE